MHTDARKLENNSLIEGDICIVGAGAAGISIAMEFANTPHKVILLEGGGFKYEDRMQELYAGTTSGQRYFPLRSIRLHYFGGTTGHWAGFCSTFDDIDFQQRDWVPGSGWPITKKDLDPFYARAHPILDLGPYDYDPLSWQERDPTMKPLPIDKKVVWDKIWQFSPPTRFNSKYRDPVTGSRNIHLYTYANVTDIRADESVGHIRELTIRNFEGRTHRVRAKTFILACCSVQNARLLLASRSQAPKGLGNDNDLVGRYFMEHIEIKSAEMWLARPEQLKMYQWDGPVTKARAELAIAPQAQALHRILNGTSSFTPLEMARGQKAMIDMWEDEKGEGMNKSMREGVVDSAFVMTKEQKDAAAKGYRAFQLFTRIEQAPNPNSRITLTDEKDELGVPRSHLHWELTPLEKKSIRKIYELIGKEAGKADIARVHMMDYLHDEHDDSWPEFTGGGWHHMGTTRMSEDPKHGVVDANCKVHGIENLYVAGSSCYVTAAAPNPTLTLVALSLRLADHVKARMNR
jgi:choline dehydrogenase-like flavoprotein